MNSKANKTHLYIRRANVFAEYAILIFIIVAAVAGVTYFVKRSIQSNVKDMTDKYIRNAESTGGAAHAGLEWASSMSLTSNSSTLQKNEQFGGNMTVTSQSTVSQTTLQAPIPSIQGWSVMEHKGAVLHIQDAATPAVTPSYPSLEYKGWEDKNWLVT